MHMSNEKPTRRLNFTLRLSQKELEIIRKAAESLHYKPATWARAALLSVAESVAHRSVR